MLSGEYFTKILTEMTVSTIAVKGFRRSLTEGKVVGPDHACEKHIQSKKRKKGKGCLNGMDDKDDCTALLNFQPKHANDPELAETLNEHKEIFKSKLPDGLPHKEKHCPQN